MTNFDPRTVHPVPAQQFGTPRPDAASYPGRTFPGPVPPPPPPKPPRGKRPLAGKIVAGLIAAGLVAGGAGTWIALSGTSADAAVQTTSFAGANPTTSPFGTDAPQVAAVSATGPQAGDTNGLYAATTPPSCDDAAFLSQLQADPAKLAAFGGVFGIGAGDVPAFVNSLSPVVLRAATSVTDHPYQDGAFVQRPAVLAAGTAVLVNSYGEPTVKCFNGNPLTAGAGASDAVTVTPTAAAIGQFRFTTIDNGGVVVVPGKPDPKPHPGPNPSSLTARYNYDGSVLLSDGRILNPDGSIRAPKAPIPAGGVVNPDGSVTVDGKTFNPDGTERTTITIPPQTIQLPVGGTTTVPGFTIRADGTAVDDKGAPLNPQPKVIFNYDGTATVISGNNVVVWGQDGNFKSKFTAVAPDKVNPDGSITKGDGSIVNPDGSTTRTPVKLPGHKTLDPNGGKDTAKDGTGPGGQTPPGTGTEKTGPTCGAVLADGSKVCQPTGSADSSTGTTGTGTSTDGTSTTGTSTTGGTSKGTGSTSGSGTGSTSGSGSGSTGSGSAGTGSSGTGSQNSTKGGTNQ
ncbi:hypothetical protein LQ327_31665 [Actinomycetospora endophytica]|uniref:DUF6777 domain-containing protein n=1 Tax=Actinomycetospora endophytica TaxID=2291215 RepID=A0ABS8PIR9_9PSEU|nr:DUF6777 domain-containing protein [Actinomycetospora endophytica]MCD2197938.1 hypothetical protein [Actinomycetospora endophytica]